MLAHTPVASQDVIDWPAMVIAALDSLRGDVWSCVLRDSTSPVTLLLSLNPSVLDMGVGTGGQYPRPRVFVGFPCPT